MCKTSKFFKDTDTIHDLSQNQSRLFNIFQRRVCNIYKTCIRKSTHKAHKNTKTLKNKNREIKEASACLYIQSLKFAQRFSSTKG